MNSFRKEENSVAKSHTLGPEKICRCVIIPHISPFVYQESARLPVHFVFHLTDHTHPFEFYVAD